MTVNELIEELKKYDTSMKVHIGNEGLSVDINTIYVGRNCSFGHLEEKLFLEPENHLRDYD